jgi:hypothetical protein
MSPTFTVAGTTFVVQQAVSISPASLKRAEVRKFFYTSKNFLLMRYKGGV